MTTPATRSPANWTSKPQTDLTRTDRRSPTGASRVCSRHVVNTTVNAHPSTTTAAQDKQAIRAKACVVTNDSGNAVLDVENGTFTLNSGTVVVDQFVMTNPCAHLVRTGGTFLYSNGQPVDTDPPVPNIPTNNYKVTTFGAVGDGATDNATAIQNTINAAAASGGTVEVPANGTLSTYLCGPITLTNNENFQIDGGALLKMLPRSIWTNVTSSSTPFINGNLIHNVEISGLGND